MDEFGGVDFDEAILSHIDQITGGALSGADGDDPQAAVALARLRQECVLAKEALSRDTETVIPVFLPGWHVEVRLTRWAFEEMVRPAVATTMGVLSRAVQAAGLISSDLTAVLLMGGSSRIPLVTEMLSQEFGRPTVDGVHPKYPVALGAASIATASVLAGSVTAGSLPARSVAPGSRGGYAEVGATDQGDEVRAPDAADVAADHAGPAGTVGRTYAGPSSFDQPTQMLVVPRHEPDLLPLVPGVDPHPQRPRRRVPLAAVAAAAAAVLVLALVYFLAPGPRAAPSVAPAVPAAPSTSAPVSPATGPPVTPTTASPTTASPTTASPTTASPTTASRTTASPKTSSTARRGGAVPRTRAATTSSRPRRPGA
jgi:hypothetical protein